MQILVDLLNGYANEPKQKYDGEGSHIATFVYQFGVHSALTENIFLKYI